MQMVSDMPKVQGKLGIPRMSLGLLSESVRLFDPEHLREVFEQLAAKAPHRPHDGRLDELNEILTVVDGSILPCATAHDVGAVVAGEPQRREAASSTGGAERGSCAC